MQRKEWMKNFNFPANYNELSLSYLIGPTPTQWYCSRKILRKKIAERLSTSCSYVIKLMINKLEVDWKLDEKKLVESEFEVELDKTKKWGKN